MTMYYTKAALNIPSILVTLYYRQHLNRRTNLLPSTYRVYKVTDRIRSDLLDPWSSIPSWRIYSSEVST